MIDDIKTMKDKLDTISRQMEKPGIDFKDQMADFLKVKINDKKKVIQERF